MTMAMRWAGMIMNTLYSKIDLLSTWQYSKTLFSILSLSWPKGLASYTMQYVKFWKTWAYFLIKDQRIMNFYCCVRECVNIADIARLFMLKVTLIQYCSDDNRLIIMEGWIAALKKKLSFRSEISTYETNTSIPKSNEMIWYMYDFNLT